MVIVFDWESGGPMLDDKTGAFGIAVFDTEENAKDAATVEGVLEFSLLKVPESMTHFYAKEKGVDGEDIAS